MSSNPLPIAVAVMYASRLLTHSTASPTVSQGQIPTRTFIRAPWRLTTWERTLWLSVTADAKESFLPWAAARLTSSRAMFSALRGLGLKNIRNRNNQGKRAHNDSESSGCTSPVSCFCQFVMRLRQGHEESFLRP